MKKKGVECSKCWYWHKVSENMGECRANPPIHLPIEGLSYKKVGSFFMAANTK